MSASARRRSSAAASARVCAASISDWSFASSASAAAWSARIFALFFSCRSLASSRPFLKLIHVNTVMPISTMTAITIAQIQDLALLVEFWDEGSAVTLLSIRFSSLRSSSSGSKGGCSTPVDSSVSGMARSAEPDSRRLCRCSHSLVAPLRGAGRRARPRSSPRASRVRSRAILRRFRHREPS